MNDENLTQEHPDARSFEERVFARFDALDARIQKLEDKQYDTKPMWERALGEIAETRRELREFSERLEIRLDDIESVSNLTRSQMFALRSDFRQFRAKLEESA